MKDKTYKLLRSRGPLSGGTKVVIDDEKEDGTLIVHSLVKNVNDEWLFAECRREDLSEDENLRRTDK